MGRITIVNDEGEVYDTYDFRDEESLTERGRFWIGQELVELLRGFAKWIAANSNDDDDEE